MDKNTKIKESLARTRLKRSGQRCVVYKFKINESKLSSKQKEQLKMMFVEGKWLYNHIVSRLNDENFKLSEFNPLVKEVQHFDKDGNEVTSKFEYLPASCRQTIVRQIESALKTIRTLRKRGFQKHGSLKFISELTSLNLKQYGTTHEIRSSTTMKIQGVSKLVKVSGLQQLRKIGVADFANAMLLSTSCGYYIALTCFVDKENKRNETNGRILGLDFGCQTSITDSDGNKRNISFGESEQLKRLQRQLSRKKVKSSNRRRKLLVKIGRKYQHITNKKHDIANKFIHEMKTYDKVVIQDEQLYNWQRSGHGKAIQHSCLGLIKAKLKQMENIVVLDRFIPTTKLCTSCGNVNKGMKLWNRTYNCPICGESSDRDVHAARNMVWIYENLVGRDAAEFTLKEFKASMSKHHFGVESKPMDDDLRRCRVFSLA